MVIVGDRTISYEAIDKRCYVLTKETMRWGIVGGTFYISANRDVERLVFFDWIKEAYPECLEWLLFHPEWLK